ncbi:hypothetical protein LXL04_033692 [Taraxacum kok-saghyz]
MNDSLDSPLRLERRSIKSGVVRRMINQIEIDELLRCCCWFWMVSSLELVCLVGLLVCGPAGLSGLTWFLDDFTLLGWLFFPGSTVVSCIQTETLGLGFVSGYWWSFGVPFGCVELLIPQLQFLDDEGAQAELWELSRVFVDALIQESGCQYRWTDATFSFARLSDRKPVEKEDEIIALLSVAAASAFLLFSAAAVYGCSCCSLLLALLSFLWTVLPLLLVVFCLGRAAVLILFGWQQVYYKQQPATPKTGETPTEQQETNNENSRTTKNQTSQSQPNQAVAGAKANTSQATKNLRGQQGQNSPQAEKKSSSLTTGAKRVNHLNSMWTCSEHVRPFEVNFPTPLSFRFRTTSQLPLVKLGNEFLPKVILELVETAMVEIDFKGLKQYAINRFHQDGNRFQGRINFREAAESISSRWRINRLMIQEALQPTTFDNNSQVGVIFYVMDSVESPATYFGTNSFAHAYQEIVDAYGVAKYQEANPTVYTVIPFLFTVMFGDWGHSICLLIGELVFIAREGKLTSYSDAKQLSSSALCYSAPLGMATDGFRKRLPRLRLLQVVIDPAVPGEPVLNGNTL